MLTVDFVALLLALLGAAVLAAWLQWRRGVWLDAAERIGRETSLAFIMSLPVLGLVFLAASAALLWGWGIWLLVGSVAAWLGKLGSDPTSASRAPKPSEILADEPPRLTPAEPAGTEAADHRDLRAS